MARQRKMDTVELMKATEALLLEKGYEGFHFKALSEKLNVARSTIYEYYSNKDELITDYMRLLMIEVMERVKALETKTSSIEMVKEFLNLFMEYSQVYEMIKMRPSINQKSSKRAAQNLEVLDSYSKELFQLLLVQIENAKKEGAIRHDLPSSLVASMIFNTVLIPNHQKIPSEEWSDLLFSMIAHGITTH
ncbi:TetR/AcrR family transcriptional regulator [Jeotgalibacillus soli]|uniref:HTH tetR-type domain-containing protein n=1 Tax=Jeotgalibacillus soli TaxID=889306 RepID=A0A0C2VCW5_9BACL|nr:TetR/AcrR family transcriptional regulator [Jeotgalibacillus soli]KIL46797.1 hypothetical protein KP78_19150 [Jeotgalibacillus soli]